MQGSYLGPSFKDEEIEPELNRLNANYKKMSNDNLIEIIAKELSNEKTVGWFQGRMEFGPRALGGRSILGDPRSPEMQKNLNLKVKYRESFRPFAPSILRDDLGDWFDITVFTRCGEKVCEKNSISFSDRLHTWLYWFLQSGNFSTHECRYRRFYS